MVKRDIIKIDEEKCTGCGTCANGCPEGAIQVIDGKARLVSDLMCDGLGACIGTCPEGAITIEKREAEPYNEKKVMGNIVKAGTNTIKAHLKHLKDHKQDEYHRQAIDYLKEHGISVPDEKGEECGSNHAAPGTATIGAEMHGCPGSATMAISRKATPVPASENKVTVPSELQNWPIQLRLINPTAEYFDNADIVVA
nr:4Fe-4S binding protein [Candidatus Sigynarchaeota archaeon]